MPSVYSYYFEALNDRRVSAAESDSDVPSVADDFVVLRKLNTLSFVGRMMTLALLFLIAQWLRSRCCWPLHESHSVYWT